MKTRSTQKQENFLFKQLATKLICILQGGKVDLYLLRISKMLAKKYKSWQV